MLVWYGVHRAVQGAPAEQEAAGQGGAEATLARAGINTGAFECAGLPVEGMYSWDSPELARLCARVSIRTCVHQGNGCTALQQEEKLVRSDEYTEPAFAIIHLQTSA